MVDRAEVLARWAYEEYDSHFSMPGGLTWEEYRRDDPEGAEAVYLAPARMQVAALDAATGPTKQREGDQRLPDGDESIVDDQQLLIDDIEARRQVGIQRYGQGHRPFNGRDTLQDLYEEQLDFLVYLRSVVRASQATRADLIEAVAKDLEGPVFQPLVARALAEQVVGRIMSWVVGQHINQTVGEEGA